MEAEDNFLSPFTVENKDKLYIPFSGQAGTEDIAKDVLRADDTGKEARDAFIENQLKRSTNFFEPVKHLNLKSLGRMNKRSHTTSSDNKVVQCK